MVSDDQTIKDSISSVGVTKISAEGAERMRDLLAIEEPLEISIRFGAPDHREQRNLSVTMRTPGNDAELATGFLFTEGIIRTYQQIEQISGHENTICVELKADVQFDAGKLQRNFYTTSSCGVCGKSSIDAVRINRSVTLRDDFSVPVSLINSLPDKLKDHQSVFQRTGGLHATALFDGQGNILFVREDIGRHNAMDKVIGAALMNDKTLLPGAVIFVSGRAGFELVQKAVIAGIPILAAVGAPSSLAVSLAEESGMTLIGFVRDQKFNIYTQPQRILL
jgi:FdhD protein